MPPRMKTRASKALKENIDVTANKLKPVKNSTKAPRKALADKTNSASDDASLEIPTKTKKTIAKTSKTGSNRNGEQKQIVEIVETKHSKQNKTLKSTEHTAPVKSKENPVAVNDVRSRRDRRLPKRFVENTALNNLANSKEHLNVSLNISTAVPKPDRTPTKKESLSNSNQPEPSPFKTPAKADSSLLFNRPRRICRLPSRFEDHSISPNKYIPIQPANASTPKQQSKTKPVSLHDNKNVGKNLETLQPVVPLNDKENVKTNEVKNRDKVQPVVPIHDKENVNKNVGKDHEKRQVSKRPTRLAKASALQKELIDNISDKSSPDSNNNAKGKKSRKKITKTQTPDVPVHEKSSPVKRSQSPIRKFLTPMSRFSSLSNKTQSPFKKVSPKKSTNNLNLSFKLLGSKKTQESDTNENRDDIYEFTFDPDEEPKPQKKKRKRTVTKKQTPAPVVKPKKVVYKSTYDQNISKALAALKNAIKPGNSTKTTKLTQITEISDNVEANVQNNEANVNVVQTTNLTKENNMAFNDTGKNSVHECNYPSIRVEDIAADIEPSMDHHDDINYSPVNSPMPNVLKSPNAQNESVNRQSPERSVHNNDPLNLAEELSFFDEQPVASSSMNMSIRDPLASPWRVEFDRLPLKWPNNTYIKPNMTPAVESSFINPEDSINTKKHVYTNMLPLTNEMFTDVADTTPNLKQTSIISFIKEMAEKSAKKKRGRSVSPFKAIYQDMVDVSGETNKNKKLAMKRTEVEVTPSSNNTSEEVPSSCNDASTDKEHSKEERKTRKRKNNENLCNVPAKSLCKQKDKDLTFFGFDESENQDENVSPIKMKINPVRGRSLKAQSKAVLKEINGPTRAVLPVAAKTKVATSSDAVNKVYEELKSAADAPVFPENNVEDNATNVEDVEINDDSQSVHLFEDIDVVHHHVKPICKSYSKAKKVTFQQYSSSDSDLQEPIAADKNNSSDYDDLGDLTFEIPNVKEKKVTKKKRSKKLRTKKEEKEAEVWAANFNSMCEDIEDFPLLVE